MKIVIGYHADCIDGFTSAWVTYNALLKDAFFRPNKEDIILHPCKYTPESEEELYQTCASVGATDLYIVDFSVSIEFLKRVEPYLLIITILDHHKTAFEKYAGLTAIDADTKWRGVIANADIFLDNAECGASLCWKHFNPDSKLPRLIEYVRDYDLWQYKYGEDTKYINKVLSAASKTIETWDELAERCEQARTLADMLYDGKRLQEKHDTLCNEVAEKAVPATIAGEKGLMVECPRELASDVGHILATKCGTFGALVSVNVAENKVNYSLRSNGDYDVSAICKQFGGGGHKNAAGFTTSLIQEK